MNQFANGGKRLDKGRTNQRSAFFADTSRNRIGLGFWHGLYHQELNATQRVGFAVLVLFYITVLIATFYMTWPVGDASFFEKIVYGYGLEVLVCLPAFLLLAFLLRRVTRK